MLNSSTLHCFYRLSFLFLTLFFLLFLKQTTFEATNGGQNPASTQLHVNGLTNKSREEERSPDRDELKEAGSEPQSNAGGEQHDKITERAW